jgi:hypothetical protein
VGIHNIRGYLVYFDRNCVLFDGYWILGEKIMKVTFFTIPKPFEGHIGIIQRNAILSWLALKPKPDVILFGDEPGTKEVAEDLGCVHIPDIKMNMNYTPYINDIFEKMQWLAETEIVCYSNCDDLFFKDFMQVLDAIPVLMRNRFLLLGERRNTPVMFPIDPNDPETVENIQRTYTLQQFPGIDYFVFPNRMIQNMPDFLVGRAGWDNWVIYHCRKNNIPVIDASKVLQVYHQNHDYAHIKDADTWKGSKESSHNLALVKNRYIYLWELADSDWVFRYTGLFKRDFSYRTLAQWVVLSSPEWSHAIIDPIFRAGHMIKWVGINAIDKIFGVKR